MDLTGKKFGRLTVIKPIGNPDLKTCLWRCKCECGNYTKTRGHHLRNGDTRSCGCLRKDTFAIHGIPYQRGYRQVPMTGKRFGKILVLEEVYERKGRNKKEIFYKCLCDCGNIKEIRGSQLRKGRAKTCGCGSKRFKIGHQSIHRLRPKDMTSSEWDRNRQRRDRRTLTDSSVKGMINHQLGTPAAEVTSQMIDVKRQQVLLGREIKKGKEVLNEFYKSV